jgi:hypothetical protein
VELVRLVAFDARTHELYLELGAQPGAPAA